MEYAIESAALFNPSMVPSVDQTGLPPGSVRFAMSLRATGEGHISSIVFRSGVIDETGQVRVDAPGLYSRPLTPVLPDEFQKDGFIRELRTLGAWNDCTQAVTDLLGARFTRRNCRRQSTNCVRMRLSAANRRNLLTTCWH